MNAEIVREVQKLSSLATEKGLRVSAAESCTGGLIGSAITDFPGASAFFLGSAVTYSNESKERLLKVPRGILFAYGAVSHQTASCMAEGSLKLFGSDVAVAVTGIAGPGGATAEKPVGLVYISVSDKDMTQTSEFRFSGTREQVREATVLSALKMLNSLISQ
ncbi:MAG: CinA family protein [Candidatus Methanomethylophilus sp.]|nr:CinA family protein [Methanomethylophilus sp.]